MTVMLLQLSLFVVTVIQLTSSQSTVTIHVTQHDSDVNCSCGRTEQVLSQLMMAVSQLQKDVIGNVSQLQSGMSELQKDVKTVIGNVSQLESGMSQLQNDVKAVIGNKETNATTKGTLRNHNSQSHKKQLQ